MKAISIIKTALVSVITIGSTGCSNMKIPDYAEVKSSPYYAECRAFAEDVYKNDGYSKLGRAVILKMNDSKAQAIVTGCVVAMGKSSMDEIKSDMNAKAMTYGMVSGACYDANCRINMDEELKAYTLGIYYATNKKFPEELKPEF
ncbi:hypothetical protein OH773_22070 (plasmid) [Buttiauxella sp. WJP83]|uniref:hypothetical protein n=1 Tax=Buttiauxella sp. WJP83 TaxID=2986951 RepID=UPI0022DD9740|nr:hypothetical protein [Buttiauxella sp. WJP83]WBM72932.1 hypothetical protein OH773_22070 [Buttiauxella sp. WJP83]